MDKILNELIRPNSLSGKIYFLLLEGDKRIIDLSKEIYNGKTQLTPLVRILPSLINSNIIYKYNKEDNLKEIFYSANITLLVSYCKFKINKRKNNEISESELKFIEIIFKSKWFRSFFKKNNWDILFYFRINYKSEIPYSPFDEISYLIEEIGIISAVLSKKIKLDQRLNYKYILSLNNFDDFVSEYKHVLNKNDKDLIKKTIASSKIKTGNYKETNDLIDYIVNNYNFIFIPPKVSLKLSKVGRIPLTLFNSLL